jgi:hypothetical protein
MGTKKPPESPSKPIARTDKGKASADRLPGDFAEEFRRRLGRHNLHLALLNLSAEAFASSQPQDTTEEEYVRQRAKDLGFHSLYPNSSLENARNYLVYAHVAYVFSAGEALCNQLRATAKISVLPTARADLFTLINKGDFVTRMIAQITLSHMPENGGTLIAVNTRVKEVKELEYFQLVNRYKQARNRELHGADNWGDEEEDEGDAVQEKNLPQPDKKKRRDDAKAPPIERLTAKDALACSKAWQRVAVWLCRHLLSEKEGLELLEGRFGNLKGTRRQQAATRFMKEALLYSPEEAGDTMNLLRW